MRAMILRQPGGLENLLAVELPAPPDPGPGEIMVHVRANSINFHDYAVASGRLAVADSRIPLSDGAADVVAVGRGVVDFAVGDMVISTFFRDWKDGSPSRGGVGVMVGEGVDGFACEIVTAPATAFTRAPHGYTHAEAATLPCAAVTAWRALIAEGNLKAGDSVLVQGTGGVSIFALQFAKAMGATVIATSSSDAKLERLKHLGVDHLINYQANPDWGKVAHDLSGGVDHVIEIGGAGTLPQSIIAAREGGHIALIGTLAGMAGPVPTFSIMAKQIRVQGITVGSRRHQQEMVAAINNIGLRPIISDSFPLGQLGNAFRYEQTHQHFGKIVIETCG